MSLRLRFRTGTTASLSNVLPGELVILTDQNSIGINTTTTAAPASNITAFVPQIAGSQGATGLMGSTGAQGVEGATGAQGFTGAQGSQGAQGVTGSQGAQGSTGSQGSQGAQGVQGVTGQLGAQGAQGAQGTEGFTGAQGSTGSAGVQGSTGAQGSTGVQGATGTQGNQGTTGEGGSQGATGATGSQGFTGTQGDTGQTGAQGATGLQGAQGAIGVQGSTGFTGAQGLTGQLGAQGDTGATGVQGAQGEQGAQGSQGAQGDTGVTGAQGAQGSQGPTGQIGAQGSTGAQGAQGFTGAQGSQGATGAQGHTGSQGAQGAQGVQGATGQTGAQGVTGAQGFTGSQGTNSVYAPQPVTAFTTTSYLAATNSFSSYNSNFPVTATSLTAPNIVASNFTTNTLIPSPYSTCNINYNTGTVSVTGNTLYIVKAPTTSFATTYSMANNLYFNMPSIIFSQCVVHPSGFAYLYSDSNAINATASNYLYSYNLSKVSRTNLSNTSTNPCFDTNGIQHVMIDTLGYVYISYGTNSNIVKCSVNTQTGALSPALWAITAPYANSRIFPTTNSVYVYASGTTSNIYRYSANKTSIQYTSAIYSNDGSLRFLSATPNDAFLFATTSTSNVYSYNVQTKVATRIASNLAATAHTPYYDAYTNNLYCSLSTANSIARIPLSGTGAVTMIASVFAPGFSGSNPQTISLYNGYLGQSNLYFMGRSNVNCYIVGASNTSYPSTTYTFNNLLDNTYTESNYTNGISGTLDGPIATARFNKPSHMAVNPINGNIYVADQSNYTIRMITPAGIVSTIAGTAGTNAQLDGNGLAARFTALNKLAINSTGTTLYAVQTSGQFNSFTSYIRTINLTSGNYEVASSSSFADAIYGMCIDPTNTYLYCTIYQALSVRRITIGSWASTTILSGDNYMNGICIDSTGSNLYLSYFLNRRISRIVIATSTITTIAGSGSTTWNGDGNGTAVSISAPGDITINTSNTALYFVDMDFFSIRMIELVSGNFTVTTISGSNAAPYGQSNFTLYNGIFWHPYQNVLYFGDNSANAIKIINSNVKPNSNVQIKNATGVPIRIAGTGSTVVRNSNIYPSLSATDVALLQNTNGNIYTIY